MSKAYDEKRVVLLDEREKSGHKAWIGRFDVDEGLLNVNPLLV